MRGIVARHHVGAGGTHHVTPTSSERPWSPQPHSSAMTTRAGTACIIHALPSIDRVAHHHDNGFDFMSRESVWGLSRKVEGRSQTGNRPCILWKDSVAVVHHVDQVKGAPSAKIVLAGRDTLLSRMPLLDDTQSAWAPVPHNAPSTNLVLSMA